MGVSPGPTVKSSSQERAVTQPNLPQWAMQGIDNYMTRYNTLAQTAPAVTVGASPLQQKAYDAAGSLGGGSNYNWAMDRVQQVGNDPGRFIGYSKPLTATNAQAATGQAAQLGDPAQVSMRGYDAEQLGDPSQIDFNQIQSLFGTPAQMGQVDIGDITQAGGARASQYMDDYLNPYLEDVVAAAMADFEQEAGKTRAAYEAQGALNNAFGGSGYYIGGSQLEGELARARNRQNADIRSDAFRFATEAGAGDANRGTQASITNAQLGTQRTLQQAQMDQQREQFNAMSENDRNQLMAQLGFNAQAYNADAGNQFALAQAGFNTDAARYGADAYNRGQEINTGYQNQFGLEQFGANNAFGMANLGNQQQMNLRNADATDAMGQYNQGFEFNRNLTNANLQNQMQDRRLSAAGLYGNMASQQGADQRAELGLLSQLGGEQYQQALAQQLTPYTQQQILAELLNPGGVMNLATGQTINSTSSGTQKQSGGLLQMILGNMAQGASMAAAASERRVKRDIVKLGEETDGLGVYRYNYVWDGADEMPRFGVMVDEVERLRPWALGPVVDGIQTVNYGAL